VLFRSTCLVAPAAATARPPVLIGAEFKSGALSATWSLPPGVEAVFLEASLSPKQEADGGFDELDLLHELEPDATSVTVTKRLEPGTYYVHVVGADDECDECPTFEYSATATVVVTYGFRKDADRTCKAYLSDARRIVERITEGGSLRKVAAAVDDLADLTADMNADLRDNPPPPSGGDQEKRFAAMLAASKRGVANARRVADALRDADRRRVERYSRKAGRAFRSALKRAKQLELPSCAKLFE
jgi:hypothetical protein